MELIEQKAVLLNPQPVPDAPPQAHPSLTGADVPPPPPAKPKPDPLGPPRFNVGDHVRCPMRSREAAARYGQIWMCGEIVQRESGRMVFFGGTDEDRFRWDEIPRPRPARDACGLYLCRGYDRHGNKHVVFAHESELTGWTEAKAV